MPVIRDFGNRFQQTLGVPINSKSGKDILKKTGIDIHNKQYQARTVVNEKRDSVEISTAAYIIHFSDSAMVSRAVSRGYITVNGVELKLSEETKQQLLRVDEQAKAEREKAYNDYVMQHEMAVVKQQSETLKKAFGSMTDTVDILEAILNTKVTPKQYENASKAYENAQGGVSWSQLEWKTYDTQMEVSIEDTIKIEGISKGEVILNKSEK